ELIVLHDGLGRLLIHLDVGETRITHALLAQGRDGPRQTVGLLGDDLERGRVGLLGRPGLEVLSTACRDRNRQHDARHTHAKKMLHGSTCLTKRVRENRDLPDDTVISRVGQASRRRPTLAPAPTYSSSRLFLYRALHAAQYITKFSETKATCLSRSCVKDGGEGFFCRTAVFFSPSMARFKRRRACIPWGRSVRSPEIWQPP